MAEERTRIDHERVAKEQRGRAEAAERAARERRAEEEEAHRLARERERSAEEERRRREEQARLDGIRTAELDRVREEAARRVAIESAMVARDHELKLAAIRHAAGARTMRLALVATSIATFGSFAGLLWLELGVHPQRLARLEAQHLSANEGERRRADRAEGLLLDSEAARRALEEKLRANDAAVELAPAAVPTLRKPPRVPPRGNPRPGVKPPPCKDDGDPLNDCLKR
jgi:dTMP kinase